MKQGQLALECVLKFLVEENEGDITLFYPEDYIDMIPILLNYDWIVVKSTWTDCPYNTYVSLKKHYRHNHNAIPLF